MHKGLIFKTLREIRGYESKEEFSKVSGLDFEEITEVENGSKPAFNRFFIWLEVSKDFVDNLYSIVNDMNIDESELVNLIKQQLTPELDKKMKTRATNMKVLFSIMQIKVLTKTELANRLQCAPSYISGLLFLNKKLSMGMLEKVANISNVKDYELLELAFKTKNKLSYYDVLIEVAKCCKDKS